MSKVNVRQMPAFKRAYKKLLNAIYELLLGSSDDSLVKLLFDKARYFVQRKSNLHVISFVGAGRWPTAHICSNPAQR
jgi:hypothetical protein